MTVNPERVQREDEKRDYDEIRERFECHKEGEYSEEDYLLAVDLLKLAHKHGKHFILVAELFDGTTVMSNAGSATSTILFQVAAGLREPE